MANLKGPHYMDFYILIATSSLAISPL